VGMSISGLPMEKLIASLLPFIVAIIVVLLVVAFIPEISLYLPKVFGFIK
jgi:TRAP-type C4-dicarboxylate transport system permease large subunit